MSTRHPIVLKLTVLQANCLLHLAQEAEPETLLSEDGISALRRRRAADAAMDALVRAMGKHARGDSC